MLYKEIRVKNFIKVDTIISAFNRKLDKNYIFEGESHDFWELQFAVKGSVYINTNNDFYRLRQGEITLFKPNQFHIIYCDGQEDAEMCVFAFRCNSVLLNLLANKIMRASDECVKLLNFACLEAARVYKIVPEPTDGRILIKKNTNVIGGEQLLSSYIESFLILLVRDSKNSTTTTARNEETIRMSQQEYLAESIRDYMEEQVHTQITLSTLAKIFGVSVSLIKTRYKETYNCSPIADFHKLKIAKAKELLALKNLSIGGIATSLSFENIYYFSNFFKKQTGFSPLEYRNFIHKSQSSQSKISKASL